MVANPGSKVWYRPILSLKITKSLSVPLAVTAAVGLRWDEGIQSFSYQRVVFSIPKQMREPEPDIT